MADNLQFLRHLKHAVPFAVRLESEWRMAGGLPHLPLVGQGSSGPLPDQFPFHLGETPQQGEDESPMGGRAVEGLAHGVQLDPLGEEHILDEGEQILRPPGQPVELPDDDVADLSTFAACEEGLEGAAVEVFPRETLIGDDLCQVEALRVSIRLDAVALRVEAHALAGLFFAGDAAVANGWGRNLHI